MSKYFPFLTGMLLLIMACQPKFKPLPFDSMTRIITEMYIAESYAQFIPRDSNSHEAKNKDSLMKFIASIFKENKTTEAEFKQSIDWYKSKPELLDSMYQQSLSDLAIWQTQINKK